MDSQQDHSICALGRHGSPKIEISRTGGGFAAVPAASARVDQSLAECVAHLLREVPALQLSRDSFLEVQLLPGQEHLQGEVLRGIRDGSSGLPLARDFSDVIEPIASVNGHDFVSVGFDDGSFELAPRCDDTYLSFFEPLAEIREEENALNVRAVGRLADGHVVYVDFMDGSYGSIVASREPISNVTAVRTWLDRIDGDPFDYVGMITYVFRDGGTIHHLADFDAEPETMKMTFTVNLTESEFEQLWALLPN